VSYAAIRKAVLLMAASALAFVLSDAIQRFRISAVQDNLNRIEFVVLAKAAKPQPSMREYQSDILGTHYTLRCSPHVSNIPQAASFLNTLETGETSPAALDSRNGGQIIACLLSTRLSVAQWHRAPPDIPIKQILLAHGIVTGGDPVVFQTTSTFLGNTYLAQFLSGTLVVIILVAIFAWRFRPKEDAKAAWHALKKAPYIVVLPQLAALIVGYVVTKSAAYLSKYPSGHFVESLFFAPVIEELLYRFLLFSLVQRYSTPLIGALVVSAAFAKGHGFDLLSYVGPFVFGLLQQAIYIRHRSVTLCVLAHVVANGAVAIIKD